MLLPPPQFASPSTKLAYGTPVTLAIRVGILQSRNLGGKVPKDSWVSVVAVVERLAGFSAAVTRIRPGRAATQKPTFQARRGAVPISLRWSVELSQAKRVTGACRFAPTASRTCSTGSTRRASIRPPTTAGTRWAQPVRVFFRPAIAVTR